MRKALHDKGWAEKQAAGFTKWLNFTMVDAEQLRHGGGDAEDDEQFSGEAGGVSSSPLKAMVAMVGFREQGVLALVCDGRVGLGVVAVKGVMILLVVSLLVLMPFSVGSVLAP